MKDQLQLIYKTLDEQFDTTVTADKFDGASEKDIFMSGVITALIIVNGLTLLDVKETKP